MSFANKKKSLFSIVFFLIFTLVSGAMAAVVSINQFVEHPSLDAIRKGMEDYLKEKKVDVRFIYHNAQANMGTAAQIAKQQIGEEADIIVAIATPSAQACAQLISKAPADMQRPLVFSGITDPVGAGLVANLEHPGGFVTGSSDRLPLERQVAMIRDFIGPFKSLGIVYNAGEANSKTVVAELKVLAAKEGFTLVEATASKTADVYQAGKSLAGRVDAVFVPTDNTIVAALESLTKVFSQAKVPLFTADVNSVVRGSVASLGIDYYQQGRQTGEIVEKILQGTKAGDIPVSFMKKLDLYINLAAAKSMGIAPPQQILDDATKVYK